MYTRNHDIGTLELTLLTALLVAIPPTLSGPTGTVGVWLSACVIVVCIAGVIRLRPSAVELQSAMPWGLCLLLSAGTGISILRSDEALATMRGAPLHWLSFMSLFAFVRLLRGRGTALQTWLTSFIFCSTLAAVVAIIEYSMRRTIRFDTALIALTGLQWNDAAFDAAGVGFRSRSTLGNALLLGTACSCAAVAALARYTTRPSGLYLIAFILNTCAVISSRSRSSWVAEGVGILFVALFFAQTISRQAVVKMGVVALLGIAGACGYAASDEVGVAVEDVMSTVWQDVVTRLTDVTVSTSYTYRLGAMGNAFEDMLREPYTLLIGYGIGGENEYFLAKASVAMTGDVSRDAMVLRTFDNFYVTTLYSGGVVMLAWLAWKIIGGIRASRAASEHLWVGAVAITLSVSIWFYNVIGAPLITLLLCIAIGFSRKRTLGWDTAPRRV